MPFDRSPGHPQAPPDFSTHEPYHYPTHVNLTINLKTLDWTPADGDLLHRVLDATAAQGLQVEKLAWYYDGASQSQPCDLFKLTSVALASPTLAEDMARAKAGQPVPGIKHRRYKA